MRSNISSPAGQQVWQALKDHQKSIAALQMRDLFTADPDRAKDLSISHNDLFIDYSKNRITKQTVDLLMSLAAAVNLKKKIDALFMGEPVNFTEHRAALHTALRAPADNTLPHNKAITSRVYEELERLRHFVEQLHAGEVRGSTGKAIKRVINIGIGGSDLGPRLVVEALYAYRKSDIDVAFAANLDAQDLGRILDDTDPATSLFIVTSKSFTTLETQANAQMAKDWLLKNGCTSIDHHFVAVSSNLEATAKFGISDERVFSIWDWVGGRYSVWSAVGLPVAVYTGMDHFMEFLGGAHSMDLHFYEAPLDRNIPVILGMLDIWYNNFFHAETLAVVPYDQRLRLLPEYLSQLVMESNGKRVDRADNTLECHSSQIVWGSVGTNAQHAFFQLLHQGNRLVPVDFLLPWQSSGCNKNHHKLVANCIAQGKALMLGRENIAEPHRHFPGNRPSTTITYKDLSPEMTGMLLAMYEHRTYVQSQVWDINPFDQWGVELGKQLAGEIISEMENNTSGTHHDPSTTQLLSRFLHNRK
jgi:glucose-6-phosphate isomerase